jgi:vancomycin resistance protein YoaR
MPSIDHNSVPLLIMKTLCASFAALGCCMLPLKAEAYPKTVIVNAGDYAETVTPSTVSSWYTLETSLSADIAKTSEIENTGFCPTDPLYCDFSMSQMTRTHIRVTLQSQLNEDAVRSFADGLSAKIDQAPVNATFSADATGNITVASPEQQGRSLDTDTAADILIKTLRDSEDGSTVRAEFTTKVSEPDIKANDLDRLGLKKLIGEGVTDFKGSTKNRIYNITRALEQFENALIAPGEDFSFVTKLGEVDGDHGYLPELVIKDNQTLPEFGGGICQVSSTVFRAAINSGLKITERRNHAYPVHYYYPYGMDATVYVPKPDLRFTNNTPGYILMQSTITGTRLTFRFFGTDDGRTVTIDGPHILESNPDGSMKTVFTQTVKNKDDETIINDSFKSNYKSPSLYPHPGQQQETILTEKPDNWSKKQWEAYKKTR